MCHLTQRFSKLEKKKPKVSQQVLFLAIQFQTSLNHCEETENWATLQFSSNPHSENPRSASSGKLMSSLVFKMHQNYQRCQGKPCNYFRLIM